MLKAIQQSSAWNQFQNNLPGRQAFTVDGFSCYLLVLKSWLKFIYIPGITKPIPKTTLNKIKKLAKKESASFIHIEPYAPDSIKLVSAFSIKSPLSYIEPHTRFLKLTNTLDVLLAEMKSKGRYNIKLSQKKDLEILEEKTVDNFFKLLQETTTRDGFSSTSKDSYQSMLDELGTQKCKLWTAFHNKEAIASIICTFHENTATYYYGASGNQHRNLMAPYLLQWHAIQFAKQNGYQYYDFLGIAPPSASKKHHLQGVSSFKEKFGGEIQKFAPAIDIPLNVKYLIYYFYKTLKK